MQPASSNAQGSIGPWALADLGQLVDHQTVPVPASRLDLTILTSVGTTHSGEVRSAKAVSSPVDRLHVTQLMPSATLSMERLLSQHLYPLLSQATDPSPLPACSGLGLTAH